MGKFPNLLIGKFGKRLIEGRRIWQTGSRRLGIEFVKRGVALLFILKVKYTPVPRHILLMKTTINSLAQIAGRFAIMLAILLFAVRANAEPDLNLALSRLKLMSADWGGITTTMTGSDAANFTGQFKIATIIIATSHSAITKVTVKISLYEGNPNASFVIVEWVEGGCFVKKSPNLTEGDEKMVSDIFKFLCISP